MKASSNTFEHTKSFDQIVNGISFIFGRLITVFFLTTNDCCHDNVEFIRPLTRHAVNNKTQPWTGLRKFLMHAIVRTSDEWLALRRNNYRLIHSTILLVKCTHLCPRWFRDTTIAWSSHVKVGLWLPLLHRFPFVQSHLLSNVAVHE